MPEIDTPTLSGGSNAGIDLVVDMHDVPTGSENRMPAKEALEYCHPDYEANVAKWKKYNDLYASNDVYAFLKKHLRENQEMWEQRVERGYYYNYVASVVDLYVSYLFHSPIVRDTKGQAAFFADFYEDADRCGTRFDDVMSDAGVHSEIDGYCGALVDMPTMPDGGYASEQERLDLGHRPYVTLIKASQIKDWEHDDYGNLVWVKIEIDRPTGRGFDQPVDLSVRNFLIWSRKDWQEWRLTGDIVTSEGSGDHPLGEVPLVLIYNEKDKNHKLFGLSAVRDIADINIALLNWCSLGDEEIFERCLNILTMPKDDNTTITLSQHNILEYPIDAAHPPSYLTPGATPLELIAKWIERAKDEIYRLAKLGGSTGLLGVREATSGVAYAFEFNETNQALSKKSANLEKADLQIHRLIAKWYTSMFTGQISYPREFGVDDFAMELQILAECRLNLTSETAIKEKEKSVVSKMYSKAPQALRDKMTQEIDAEEDAKITGALDYETINTPEPELANPSGKEPGSGSAKGTPA